MREDSNKYSIETIYKGIKMKSMLETKIALFLDYLNIKWIYEPKAFMLKIGEIYKPDFFLPEHNQWIEVKGVVEKHQFRILKALAEETGQEVIMISGNKVFMFHHHYGKEVSDLEDSLNLGFCQGCKTHFFCSFYGSYKCTKCGHYDGDHDIIAHLYGDFDNVDFHNVVSIKAWVKRNAVSV